MANFTKTITNTVNCFGPAPTFWNFFNWGSGKWGEGSQGLVKSNNKAIANSQSISDDYVTLFYAIITITNQISTAFEMTQETLTDAAGYNYVFTGNTTNSDDRVDTVYQNTSSAAVSWTADTKPTTTWSDS